AIMRNKHDIEDLAFEALHSAKKNQGSRQYVDEQP
ncbi:hypothetical protein AC22_5699, partial [Escherichia coli 5-366-08_S3_C2]